MNTEEIKDIVSLDWITIGIYALVSLAIAIVIAKCINKIFNKNSNIRNNIHYKLIRNTLVALDWFVAALIVLLQFKELTNFASTVLAGSGIVAVVLGLAAQESFSNIFSGLFISIFKPFDIGDRIRIVGDETAGYVEDITLRHTVIRTYMNVHIIIPNSIMGSSKIENTSYEDGASYPIDITIAYEDKAKRYRALEIMEEVVTSHPLFYDNRTEEQRIKGVKAVEATCTGFGDSGINLRILVWTEDVRDNNRACSECRLQILDRFEEEGIEIPYNKLVVFSNNFI